MDQTVLPLNFYCRNARLYLKKATFSKKSQLFHDELSHLRKFESLVGSIIPEHPQFEDKKADKQIVELQIFLGDARKRMQELEVDSNRSHILGNLKSSPAMKSEKLGTTRSKSSARSPRSVSSGEPITSSAVPAKLLKKPLSRALPSSSKKVDSPRQKLQQSWGVWTANPHDTTLAPPSKKHTTTVHHKGRKLEGDVKSPPSSSTREVLILPLKPSSPDQSAEAILGGCALLATHLQSFEDGRNDLEKKDPALDWMSSGSKSHDRPDYAQVPNLGDEFMSLEKSTIEGRKFRFASDFFEKKLQDRRNHAQHHATEPEAGASGSISSKIRGSAERAHEEASQQRAFPDGSTRDGSAASRSSRFPTISLEGTDPLDKDGLDVTAENMWARNLVPAVEQKLTHEMLRSRRSPGHSSGRKRHKQRGVLSVMDEAIRQAVDSDSDASSRSSAIDGVTPKRSHALQKESTQVRSMRQAEDGQMPQGPPLQGLQVETLEKKITSLQGLVGDLKGSVEGFTSRVENEVGSWQSRMQMVETQMMAWRDDAEKEFLNIKGNIEVEVQTKLENLSQGLSKTERLLVGTESRKEISQQRLENRLEGCSTRLDSLKRQVDSLTSDVNMAITRDMKDRISQTMQDMSKGVKGDLELLELGVSKDLENLRGELDVKLDSLRTDFEKARRAEKQQLEALIEEKMNLRLSPRIVDMVSGAASREKVVADIRNELHTESEKLRRAERQQLEAFLEEKIEKCLSQPLEIVSGGKDKVLADMKTELRLLWVEIDLLIKGREEIKDNMEQLNQIAEKAKDAIGKEQDLLKTENGTLKKQLQCCKKESMQTQMDMEDFKKGIDLEVEDMRLSIQRLKDEGQDTKDSIACLKKVRDDLMRENRSLRKLIEGVREESAARRLESKDLRRKEEVEMMQKGGGTGEAGSCEKALIMERVEKLSQLYLGGLDEVRRDLTSVKLACDERLEELESQWLELKQQQESNAESDDSLRELMLDGLEMRIANLESTMEEKESFDEEQSKVRSAIADIEKDREHVASALAQVTVASQNAERLMSETLGTFHSEMENMRRQSLMIQEKLASEKDAAATALAEVLRMRDNFGKETESAISIISDTTAQFREGLEKEREGLLSSIMMSDKEKEAALRAASQASAAAESAGQVLGEIIEVRRKSLCLSADVAEAVGQAHMKYGRELEGHIEEWRRHMEEEVCKAKSKVEGIEEVKRRSVGHIEGWRNQLLDEVSKARSVVQGIEEEKRKSFSVTEVAMIQEKHHFEEHKRVTEATIQHLAEAIEEMTETLDLKMQSLAHKQEHTEQKCEQLRSNVHELGEGMKEASMRLDKIIEECKQIAEEMRQGDMEAHEKSESLKQEIVSLARTVGDQSAIVETVKKVETVQEDLLHSVEELQASMAGEMEKLGAAWLQKYEAAGRVLQEIERRLSSLENASLDDRPDEQLDSGLKKGHHIAPAEKQRLVRLYRDLSNFLKKMTQTDSEKDGSNMDDCYEDEWTKAFKEKLGALESHVEHVESGTLKVLESKMEELSVGMQTALEGASMAESKCTALGAELVKVFRMLASSRKDSPTRMMVMIGGDPVNEETEQHHHKPPHAHGKRTQPGGPKAKTLSSHAACTYCKRAAMKGSSDMDCTKENHDGGHHHQETRDNSSSEGQRIGHYHDNVHTGRISPCMNGSLKECGLHGKPPLEPQHPTSLRQDLHDFSHLRGYDLPPEKVTSRRNVRQNEKQLKKGDVMDDFEALEQLLRKKSGSELKACEGKVPITLEKLDDHKRLEYGKKDSTHSDSGGKNCQSTNIRLDAGKIQVNVSHRSALLSSTRFAKRADAIPVHP